MGVTGLLCLVLLAQPTLGRALGERYVATQPAAGPIEAAQHRIAAERAVLDEPRLSPAERLAIIQRILDIRAELIRAHVDDVRRGMWLADQAADLFFILLPIEASGLTSQFGAPSREQRVRAQRVAREMNDLAGEAEIEIERAILALESTPGYADDIAAQIKRRRLTEEERDRRIPFLRGIGAYLHAELNVQQTARRRALYERAARLLEPLGATLQGTLAGRARLYAGLALVRVGEFEAAKRLFTDVTADPESDPADVFAVRMGTVMSRVAQRGPQAALGSLDSIEQGYTTADDLFFRVLIADQRFLLRRRLAAEATGRRRDELLRQAFDAYIDLLDAEWGARRGTLRRIVFARLTAAADADLALERLPAIVAVARAAHLGRDDDTRPQAIALFEQLLSQGDLDQRERAEALFGLGRGLLADDQLLQAAERFAQLARDHPTEPEAERSIELAATIAAELHRQIPNDPQARIQLRETLDLLLSRYPNLASVDRWRYMAGRLALGGGRYEEALVLFEQIPPDAKQWLDAQFMRADVLRSWAEAESDPAEHRRLYTQLLDVIQEVRPAIERPVKSAASDEAADSLRGYLVFLTVFQAAALVGLGEPQQAIEVLQGIDADLSLDSAKIARVLLARIDAYWALERSADVAHQIERLLEVAPDEAGGILAAMLEARQRDVTALIEMSRHGEAVELARRELAPLAGAADRWLATQAAARSDATGLRLRAADAYRLAERWDDALRLYDQLVQAHPNAVEVLFGRAECLFGLGGERYVGAMSVYKRISNASAAVGDDYYWQSQLRMLQILDRTNRNTHRIAPHIQRLRRKAPQLGGERFRRRFEALQNKYS